jgi:hypothetical protein
MADPDRIYGGRLRLESQLCWRSVHRPGHLGYWGVDDRPGGPCFSSSLGNRCNRSPHDCWPQSLGRRPGGGAWLLFLDMEPPAPTRTARNILPFQAACALPALTLPGRHGCRLRAGTVVQKHSRIPTSISPLGGVAAHCWLYTAPGYEQLWRSCWVEYGTYVARYATVLHQLLKVPAVAAVSDDDTWTRDHSARPV